MRPANRSAHESVAPSNRAFGAADRPFDILGIGEEEERVYRWLLAHPRSTMREAARSLAMPTRKLQRLLGAIEAK
jgi:hypothetical protein